MINIQPPRSIYERSLISTLERHHGTANDIDSSEYKPKVYQTAVYHNTPIKNGKDFCAFNPTWDLLLFMNFRTRNLILSFLSWHGIIQLNLALQSNDGIAAYLDSRFFPHFRLDISKVRKCNFGRYFYSYLKYYSIRLSTRILHIGCCQSVEYKFKTQVKPACICFTDDTDNCYDGRSIRKTKYDVTCQEQLLDIPKSHRRNLKCLVVVGSEICNSVLWNLFKDNLFTLRLIHVVEARRLTNTLFAESIRSLAFDWTNQWTKQLSSLWCLEIESRFWLTYEFYELFLFESQLFPNLKKIVVLDSDQEALIDTRLKNLIESCSKDPYFTIRVDRQLLNMEVLFVNELKEPFMITHLLRLTGTKLRFIEIRDCKFPLSNYLFGVEEYVRGCSVFRGWKNIFTSLQVLDLQGTNISLDAFKYLFDNRSGVRMSLSQLYLKNLVNVDRGDLEIIFNNCFLQDSLERLSFSSYLPIREDELYVYSKLPNLFQLSINSSYRIYLF